jgi:hypothetical protein
MITKLDIYEAETETIDKLFLELSQFTKAKTAREIKLQHDYNELIMAVARKHHEETRHQTALRYIQEAERAALSGSTSCSPNTKDQHHE